jgi:hypothetical protein
VSDTADDVVQAAGAHGGSADGWVNHGIAADNYWRAKYGAEEGNANMDLAGLVRHRFNPVAITLGSWSRLDGSRT